MFINCIYSCDQSLQYGGGDDDDVPCQGSSSLHETFVPFGNDTHVPGYDQSLSQPLSTALVGDNLIAQPRKVLSKNFLLRYMYMHTYVCTYVVNIFLESHL